MYSQIPFNDKDYRCFVVHLNPKVSQLCNKAFKMVTKVVKSLIHKINAFFVLHIFDNFHSCQNMSQIHNKFKK